MFYKDFLLLCLSECIVNILCIILKTFVLSFFPQNVSQERSLKRLKKFYQCLSKQFHASILIKKYFFNISSMVELIVTNLLDTQTVIQNLC